MTNARVAAAAFLAVLLPAIVPAAGCSEGTKPTNRPAAAQQGADKFLALGPGMSVAEVIGLIGEPTAKDQAAGESLRAVMLRLPEFDTDLPPGFDAEEEPNDDDAAVEAEEDSQEIEGENWLYGPYRNLQKGDYLLLVQITGGKLASAARMTVTEPPRN